MSRPRMTRGKEKQQWQRSQSIRTTTSRRTPRFPPTLTTCRRSHSSQRNLRIPKRRAELPQCLGHTLVERYWNNTLRSDVVKRLDLLYRYVGAPHDNVDRFDRSI